MGQEKILKKRLPKDPFFYLYILRAEISAKKAQSLCKKAFKTMVF